MTGSGLNDGRRRAKRAVCGALAALGLMAASGGAFGQDKANPELLSHNYFNADGSETAHALTINRFDLKVVVAAGTAHVTAEAAFANPTAGAIEGDFTLALPAGAVVTGYALDVDGRMVDGVLTSQRTATLAYNRRLRRGADPGVAEVTRDNAFRTHVFPILPGRGRTIRVEYVAPLDPQQPLSLPFSTLDPVGQASVLVTLAGQSGRPPVLSGPDGLDLQWTHGADGLEARARTTHARLAGALVLGAPADPPAVVARHHDGDSFVVLEAKASAAAAASTGGRVRVYWDTSLSRRTSDTAQEIAFLERYLEAARPHAIDLVLFADAGPRVSSYATAAEAVRALRAVDYGGAASLKGVLNAAHEPASTCLFFSDGPPTIDAYAAEPASCLLFTVSSAPSADRGFLTALARKSGGEHLDLTAQPAASALERVIHPGLRVRKVQDSTGQPLDFTVLPGGPGAVRIVARAGDSDQLTVTMGDGQGRMFDLSDAPEVAHDGPGDLWAADRIADISAEDRPDLEAALGLARRYGVAAGGATFLVLEQVSDYAEAGVAPPAALGKAALSQYAALAAERAEALKSAQAERLDHVVQAWTEEKVWWSGDHPVPPPRTARRPELSDGAPPPPVPMAAAPPAPPPPAAIRPMAPPANSGSELQEVVVTGSRASRRDYTSNSPITTVGRRGAEEADTPEIEVEIEPWNPDRPYLKALRAAGPEGFHAVFREQEKRYGAQPAFYLDVAEFLVRQDKTAEAASMALNALELPTADTTTLNIVAERMLRYGQFDRAIWLYERVLYLDPDRPQPRRALALALQARAESQIKADGEPTAQAKADEKRALALLNEVITKVWDGSYDGFEMVALMEANRIVPRLQRMGVRDLPLDRRLRALLDVDVRVVLEWYVDATDMDLWVDEPSGERAIYSHPSTAIGGRLSHDMTQGYGPEEYLLRKAPNGEYTVRVNIYRTDILNRNGAITVRAHVFRDYGRPSEAEQVLDLELKPGEDGTHVVGRVKVGAAPAKG
jgi:hypothetical protein